MEHRRPGNRRDLGHCLERARIFSGEPSVLPQDLLAGGTARPLPHAAGTDQTLHAYPQACEKRCIKHRLRAHQGRIDESAEELGICRKMPWEKMKRLDIAADE